MNFILRSTQSIAAELPRISETKPQKDVSKPPTTLGGLFAEDPYPNPFTGDVGDNDSDGIGDASGVAAASSLKNHISVGNHSDVTENEGWIVVPCKGNPDGWSDASSIHELHSLDRSFVFPGEQLCILVCLSASKQDSEIITPFRVAALMSKDGNQNGNPKMENSGRDSNSVNGKGNSNGLHDETAVQFIGKNGTSISKNDDKPTADISTTESFLQREEHRQQTVTLLERFRNSNFFVRIAEADDPLWSKRSKPELPSVNSELPEERASSNDGRSRKISKGSLHNAVMDRGSFACSTSGGVARNVVKCYSLPNGDIVVLLQVNVGVGNVKDPVLEVLQFEKYQSSNSGSNAHDSSLASILEDPCRELLSWLLPLDGSLSPAQSLSPPLGSTSGLGAGHQRSSSSGSQFFSFGHFRSYSMPSLPQVTTPSSSAVPSSSKPAFDLEDLDRFSPEKLLKSQDIGKEGLASFRGIPLEPDRFCVHCGLEGIYLPGKRWRRKLEIVQPIEVHSFVTECDTEDLLCVQVKNVSPAHLPDLVIFLDAITIVFEEASQGGAPPSLPIASIEAGSGQKLPNLALRRGEEHSFILRPAATIGRDCKGHRDPSSLSLHPKLGAAASFMNQTPRFNEGIRVSSSEDQFAVLVSCRCNFSESKLFFKQPTSWQPRVARDLMISVSSQTTEQLQGPIGSLPQLPVQVLTLQASNLTPEDLSLTVNAPISSSTSLPVVSLNSATLSPSVGFPELLDGVGGDKLGLTTQRLSSMPTVMENQKDSGSGRKRSFSLGQHTGSTSDFFSSSNSGCTHLWLQSKVPLGCIPAHSSATVKLELLPLTDGIITLDTLQVAVKEKGLAYVPEQPLKIYVTSSVATGYA